MVFSRLMALWTRGHPVGTAPAFHGVRLVGRGSIRRLLRTPSDMRAWWRAIPLNTIRRRWELSLNKLQIPT